MCSVIQVPGLMSRSGIFTDGSFVISTVIKEDTGWYKCRPSNGLGPPPEAQAYLNVTCEYHVLLLAGLPLSCAVAPPSGLPDVTCLCCALRH